MKVIILAAGKGSRLGQADQPKPLTRLINGKSILEHQLTNIEPFVSLDHVIAVVGYRKEMIMDAFPELLFVYNPKYASENTSKSLLRALKKVDDDVLWINGDVVFHPTVLKNILTNMSNRMVVNVGKVGEEEVKYRTDAKGNVLEVSKQVINAQGEVLGIYLFTKKDVPVLRSALEKCRDDDYFEKGMEFCIKEGIEIQSVPVDAHLCTEVDFPTDLEHANTLINQWAI